MKFVEIATGILQLPARARSIARSHAYVLRERGRPPLVVEPSNLGDGQDLAQWVEWFQEQENEGAIVVCTHEHIDHVHGLAELQQSTGCEVWAPPFRVSPHTPLRQYRVTRELHEGDTLGDWHVLDMRGHALEHVAFQRGSVVIGGDAAIPGDGHPHEYLASLKKLIALDPDVFLPAHGFPIVMRSLAPWIQVRAILEARG